MASRGARVIIASENLPDCQRAKRDIQRLTGNKDVEAQLLDLGDLASVRQFASDFIEQETRLDILINNAGNSAFGSRMSKDGLALGLQINYFGHFLLTHLLIG